MSTFVTDLVHVHEGAVTVDWQRLLHTAAEDMSEAERLIAISLIDLAKKAFEAKDKELKPLLREQVLAEGEVIDETSRARRMVVGDVEVHVTPRKDTLSIDEVELEKVCRERGLEVESFYVTKVVLDERAIVEAISTEKLTSDDVKRITERKPNTASVAVKRHVFGLTPKKLLEGNDE